MTACEIAGGGGLHRAPNIVDTGSASRFKSALCQVAGAEGTSQKVHLLQELISDIGLGKVSDVNLEHDGYTLAGIITDCHVDLQVELSKLLLSCIKSVPLDVSYVDERRGIVSTPALLKFYDPLHEPTCRNLLPNVAAGEVCCQFYCHLLATCSSLDAFENLTWQFNRTLTGLIGEVDVNDSPGKLPTEDARIVIGIMKTLLNTTKAFGSPPAPFELLRDMATNVICATNVHMCRLYSYNLIAFLLRKSPGRLELQAALPGLKLAQVDQIYALLKEANHGNDDDVFEYRFLYSNSGSGGAVVRDATGSDFRNGNGAALSAGTGIRASVAATALNSGSCSTKVSKSDSVATQASNSISELHTFGSRSNFVGRSNGVPAPKAKMSATATEGLVDAVTLDAIVFRGEWLKLLEKQFNKVGNDATNYDREAWKQKQQVLNQIINGLESASQINISNTIQQIADVLSTALKNESAIPIVQGLLKLFCLLQQSSVPNLISGCKSLPLCEHVFQKMRQSNRQILNWAMAAVGLLIKNNLDCGGILDLVTRSLESKSPQAKEAMCSIISGEAPLLKDACHVALLLQPHKQDVIAALQVLSSDKTPKVRNAAALAIKAMQNPNGVQQKYFNGNVKRALDESKAGANDGKAGPGSNLASRALKRRVLKQNNKTASEDEVAIATRVDTRLTSSSTATAFTNANTTARTTAVVTPKLTGEDTHTPVAPPVATPVAERRGFAFNALAPTYTGHRLGVNVSTLPNSPSTVAATISVAQQLEQQGEQQQPQAQTLLSLPTSDDAKQLLSRHVDAAVLERIARSEARCEGIVALCDWTMSNRQQASKLALPILQYLHLHTCGFSDQSKGVVKALYALLVVIIELDLGLDSVSFLTRAIAKQVSYPKAALILQRLLELYDCNVIWGHVFDVCDSSSTFSTIHALVEVVNFQCRNHVIDKVLSKETLSHLINWLCNCNVNIKGTLVDVSFQTLQLLACKLGVDVVLAYMEARYQRHMSQALAATTADVAVVASEPLEASSNSIRNCNIASLDAWSHTSAKWKFGYASARLGLEPEISKDLYLCMFQRGNVNNLKRACVFWRVFIKQGSPKCFKMLYDVNNVRLEILIWLCHTLLSRVAERVLLEIIALITAGLQQHQLLYSLEEAQLLINVLAVYKGTLEADAIDALLQSFPRENSALIEIAKEQLAQVDECLNAVFLGRLKSWLDTLQKAETEENEPASPPDAAAIVQQQGELEGRPARNSALYSNANEQQPFGVDALNTSENVLATSRNSLSTLDPSNTIEAPPSLEPTITPPLETLDVCTSQATNTNDSINSQTNTSATTRISCSSNITIDSIGCQQDVEDGSLENNLQELIESCTRLSWEIQSVTLADQKRLCSCQDSRESVNGSKRHTSSIRGLGSSEDSEGPFATSELLVEEGVNDGNSDGNEKLGVDDVSLPTKGDKQNKSQAETTNVIDQRLGLLSVTREGVDDLAKRLSNRLKEQSQVVRNIVVPTAFSITETLQRQQNNDDEDDDDHIFAHIADGSSQMDSVASRSLFEAEQARRGSNCDKGTGRQDFILAQVGWLVCKCSWLANICLLTRYDDYKQLVTNIYDKGLVETCASTTAAILAWSRASFANRILVQVAPLVVDVCHVAILRLCRHVEIVTSEVSGNDNASVVADADTSSQAVVAIAQLLKLFLMVVLPFQQQTQLHFCAIVIHCLALPKGCFGNGDFYSQLTQLIRATCTSINIQALSQILLCSLELTTKSIGRGEKGRILLALLRFTRILQTQLLERLKTSRAPASTLAKLTRAHHQLVQALEPPRKSCTLEKKITDTLVTTQHVLRSIQS